MGLGYKSAKWGYPNYNLLITLLTKSHEPLSTRSTTQSEACSAKPLRNGLGCLLATWKPAVGSKSNLRVSSCAKGLGFRGCRSFSSFRGLGEHPKASKADDMGLGKTLQLDCM